MKRHASSLALVLALAAAALCGPVRADDLPKASEVIAKFTQATGGDAWKKIESMKVTGAFEMPSMGIVANLVIAQNVTGSSRTEVEIPGMGVQSQGTSDGVAWELSMMSGPRILEGLEASSALRRADPVWFLHWEKHFPKAECTAIEDVEGQPCYRVELTATDGSMETHFFSVETGLEVQTAMTMQHQMGEIPATMLLSEYKEFDGILVPTRLVQRAAGMEQVIVVKSVELNPKFEEGVFALPAEVAALLQPAGK